MEPITAGAIAIGTVVATKALEKTGEKVGETLFERTSTFLAALTQQSPQTVTTIEKALEEPIDYGNAVLEVESAAVADAEVNQAMQELVEAAKAEPPANLTQVLQNLAAALQSQSSNNQTWISTIEKIVNFAQRDIHIQTQNISI